MFQKILIANRGEIAARIIRACQELGIASVAVYSEADAGALHVRLANEAHSLGAAAPNQSYLNIPAIIQAALHSGAQAVHPGFGFLAENAEFARAVQAAGLIFIGPSPAAIEAMGDKTTARAAMQAAGVPVVPGYQPQPGTHASLADFTTAAAEMGYPVLLKAAAGGGGRGMRVVNHPNDLPAAFDSARREAQNAFADDRLFLEKYLAAAHHIEFQVLADAHGHTVHLFERECSVQRRHQKIIEESPSPLLTTDLRNEMGAAAVAAAQAVNYVNAGTVEFIVDAVTHQYYFLEMNTRLQVEHPVTEAVTGLDLVHLQLAIAAGQPLPFTQADLTLRGHAIEARVYAEDPANGFLPHSGPVLLALPPTGPGLRIDAGVETGDTVTVHYDPMIAKVIAYGDSRDQARRRLHHALGNYTLLGLPTNITFLQQVLNHPEYISGQATTGFVGQQFDNWQPPTTADIAPALLAAALFELHQRPTAANQSATLTTSDPHSPWALADSFRLGQGA